MCFFSKGENDALTISGFGPIILATPIRPTSVPDYTLRRRRLKVGRTDGDRRKTPVKLKTGRCVLVYPSYFVVTGLYSLRSGWLDRFNKQKKSLPVLRGVLARCSPFPRSSARRWDANIVWDE